MNLNEVNINDVYEGTVKVLRKIKPGPVILSLTDGTKIIDGVIKHTGVDVNDVVHVKGRVLSFNNKLQLEIDSISHAEVDFNVVLDEKSRPVDVPLSVESEKLGKMRPSFLRIAQKIRKAIMDAQPILVRHHNDADGYSCGITLEEACVKLMKNVGVEPDYHFFRFSCRAPFYEITDALKDFTLAKRLEGKGQKKPLILVVDNGSTPEDEMALKTMKQFGFDIIVIDHHNPVVFEGEKTSVCKYLTDHVNPYLFGMTGEFSAGILCYEISRLIVEYENKVIPAFSCIGDRIENAEADQYIEQSGLSKDELIKIASGVDFLSYHIKFDASTELFQSLFTNNTFRDIIYADIVSNQEKQLRSVLPAIKYEEVNGKLLATVNLDENTMRFMFPTAGKVTSELPDKIQEEKGHENILVLGYMNDMIIVRATTPFLPVQTIIDRLCEKFPAANVDGGGHEQAGTIKFVSSYREKILEEIKGMLE